MNELRGALMVAALKVASKSAQPIGCRQPSQELFVLHAYSVA